VLPDTETPIESDMPRDAPSIDPLSQRIRAEFLEMPGLHLTLPQAARLWHVDLLTCAEALALLARDRFLRRSRSGGYLRAERA
jgi:hypothetical protein